jgi:peptide/nickel transport system substrate-binding protein
MRCKDRVLGHPLVMCMLAGAVALVVAACGGSSNSSSSSSSSNSGGATSSSSSSTSASAPSTGGTVNASLGTSVFGTLPPVSTNATKGGTVTVSQQTGQTPVWIFPIADSAHTTTGTITFLAQLFMPLYAGPDGAEPKVNYAQSFAQSAPVPSNGDKTYTIHLKKGLKWSDGKPMDANDVLFSYNVLRAGIKASASNWGQYVPGKFPMSVTSATAPNKYTVVFKLDKAINPGYFLNNQLQVTDNFYPMPSTDWNETAAGQHSSDWKSPAVAGKIYSFLAKAGGSVAQFGSNPLWKTVSGPFELHSFSATNSSYVLTPNPDYGGTPKPVVDQVDVNTYTSQTASLNALKGGSLDIDFGVDPSEIAQLSGESSQGIDLYGGPGWGWFGGIYNFNDQTDHFAEIIKQLYARQVLAYLQNEAGIIKGVYKGAAVTAYGPTPSSPASPYAPASATQAPYPYNPAKAVSILKAHGWSVKPNGQTTCAKAGSAASDCGPGIPAGTPFKFVWANQPESASPASVLASEAIASEAKQAAGIDIELQTKTFNFLVSEYTNTVPGGLKNHNEWGVNNYGGLYEDYYPTNDGVLNHPGTLTKPASGFNTGNYSDSKANSLINASVFGKSASDVKAEGAYLEKEQPVLYGADQDWLIAVNTKKVGSVDADGWLTMTQQQPEPQYWFSTSGS